MEKATKAWHRQGRQELTKTKNSHSQANRLSTGTTHRSSTGLLCKMNPRVKSYNSLEHRNPACISNTLGQRYTDQAPPTSESCQQMQPSAQRTRAEPHSYTDTARNRRDTRHPPFRGARHREP